MSPSAGGEAPGAILQAGRLCVVIAKTDLALPTSSVLCLSGIAARMAVWRQ